MLMSESKFLIPLIHCISPISHRLECCDRSPCRKAILAVRWCGRPSCRQTPGPVGFGKVDGRSQMLNGFKAVTGLRPASAPFRRGTLRSRPVQKGLKDRGFCSAVERGGHAHNTCAPGLPRFKSPPSRRASQVALYIARVHAQIAAVSFDQAILVLAAGLLGAGAIWVLSHHLSREARLSRRRRRNNTRLEPKVNRPMVRLSVRTRRGK